MPRRRNVIVALLWPCSTAVPAGSGRWVEVWVEPRIDAKGIDLDALAGDLRRLGAEELARVRQPEPGIAVRVDAAQLDAIRQLPSVRRIRPARVLHPPTPGTDPGPR